MTAPHAIVLGAAVWAGGAPSPTLRRRAETAARLYRAGKVAGIVASGGLGRHPPSEAEAIAGLLTAAGVPEAAILREDRARTTLDNLRFSRDLLPPGTPVVIVTDAWHLPRARLVARRLGLSATGAAPPLRGARVIPTLRAVLREAAALVFYLLRPMR